MLQGAINAQQELTAATSNIRTYVYIYMDVQSKQSVKVSSLLKVLFLQLQTQQIIQLPVMIFPFISAEILFLSNKIFRFGQMK